MLITLLCKWENTRIFCWVWPPYSTDKSSLGHWANGGMWICLQQYICNELYLVTYLQTRSCNKKRIIILQTPNDIWEGRTCTNRDLGVGRLGDLNLIANMFMAVLSYMLYSMDGVGKLVWSPIGIELTWWSWGFVGHQCIEDCWVNSNAAVPSAVFEYASAHDWRWGRNSAGLLFTQISKATFLLLIC